MKSYINETPSEETIQQITQLQVLDCSKNLRIESLYPLVALKELQELNISNTLVESLEVLAQLPQLKRLYALHSKIKDLSPLAQLQHLEIVQLNYSQVESLQALQGLPKLQQLSLSGTKLSPSEIEHFQTMNPHCQIHQSEGLF